MKIFLGIGCLVFLDFFYNVFVVRNLRVLCGRDYDLDSIVVDGWVKIEDLGCVVGDGDEWDVFCGVVWV